MLSIQGILLVEPQNALLFVRRPRDLFLPSWRYDKCYVLLLLLLLLWQKKHYNSTRGVAPIFIIPIFGSYYLFRQISKSMNSTSKMNGHLFQTIFGQCNSYYLFRQISKSMNSTSKMNGHLFQTIFGQCNSTNQARSF